MFKCGQFAIYLGFNEHEKERERAYLKYSEEKFAEKIDRTRRNAYYF